MVNQNLRSHQCGRTRTDVWMMELELNPEPWDSRKTWLKTALDRKKPGFHGDFRHQ